MGFSAGFAGVALALATAGTAAADTIFDNPYLLGAGGNCSFNTTCAADISHGDDFAAQAFVVSGSAVATSASFTELDFGTTPTDVNWGIALADGPGGLPGTILSAGTDTITGAQSLGTDNVGGNTYDVTKLFFDVGPQAFGPGVYYFAVQAISPTHYAFLGGGAALFGAAETMDGGVTWASGYEGYDSIAVALYGTVGGVPEPAAWGLMLVGFGAAGGVLRRRTVRAQTA
jgi:hypothetical protein